MATKKKPPHTFWNHRILVHASPYSDEITFVLHEVHYRDGKPVAYGQPAAIVMGEHVEDLESTLIKMLAALKKPALWAGDKFPQQLDKQQPGEQDL